MVEEGDECCVKGGRVERLLNAQFRQGLRLGVFRVDDEKVAGPAMQPASTQNEATESSRCSAAR